MKTLLGAALCFSVLITLVALGATTFLIRPEAPKVEAARISPAPQVQAAAEPPKVIEKVVVKVVPQKVIVKQYREKIVHVERVVYNPPPSYERNEPIPTHASSSYGRYQPRKVYPAMAGQEPDDPCDPPSRCEITTRR